jgi:hypothetical protein
MYDGMSEIANGTIHINSSFTKTGRIMGESSSLAGNNTSHLSHLMKMGSVGI